MNLWKKKINVKSWIREQHSLCDNDGVQLVIKFVHVVQSLLGLQVVKTQANFCQASAGTVGDVISA